MRRKLILSALVAALMLVPAQAAFADNHNNAQIVVVHGVPGLDVDVLVNGSAAITNFSFADDPVVTSLPAGDYTLAVAATGTTDPVLTLDATLVAGTSVTVAAYLDANGNPQLRAFTNQNATTGIQPFHLANFGAVDIFAGGNPVLEGVVNGRSARIDVPGGTTVSGVGIGAAGTGTIAIDLGSVTVPANTLVLAYAIGPDTGASLPSVVVATVDVASHASSVPSGSGGDAAASTLPVAWLIAALAASLVMATGARRFAVNRSR